MILPSPSPFPVNDFDYRLLDSGRFRKLEQFGPHVFIRPAPQAIWPSSRPAEEWDRAEAEYRYFKGKETGGKWNYFSDLPEKGWNLRFKELTFKVRPTGFGHIGLFPEQALNWLWLMDTIRRSGRDAVHVLNVFGYTGASTLAAAAAGAHVTHVDASKASVTWARENLALSGLADKPVRWIVDDVPKFLNREYKRGRRYDGIIMDPPTFGRGPNGEVWKIETRLAELMKLIQKILSDGPLFVLLTTHSPGFSGLTLKNMVLKYLVSPDHGTFDTQEMYILDTGSGLHLPNGFYSRWSNGASLPIEPPSSAA